VRYAVQASQEDNPMLITVEQTADIGALRAIRVACRLRQWPEPTSVVMRMRNFKGVEGQKPEWMSGTGLPVTAVEAPLCGTAYPPPRACSCIHQRAVHCPITGACLYTNPIHGPCPCDSTPDDVRVALSTAWRDLKEAT